MPCVSAKIIMHAPTKPRRTPIILFLLNGTLKKKLPKNNAKIGVVEFCMPTMALSILVSATQKQMAGNILPNNPKSGTYFIFCFSIFSCFLLKKINGINAKNAKLILNAATWKGLNASNPFLIKKNENPQMIDKPKNVIQSIVEILFCDIAMQDRYTYQYFLYK